VQVDVLAAGFGLTVLLDGIRVAHHLKHRKVD